ncbi:hypothetical protein ACFV0C_00230 [Streptomyces sp. NPDC059568]|uniref:hypothetical protein n=1 Tax=Streptomyces sp. NPDC059568 TaxID=3346868 RepID=UPI00368428BE
MPENEPLSAEHIPLTTDGIKPAEDVHLIRRLVTAVDSDGKSYFAQDSRAPHLTVIAGKSLLRGHRPLAHDADPRAQRWPPSTTG